MKTIYKKLLFLMLLLPFGVFAQSIFEGTVVDKASNQPIPGVNVVIQGEANGTQTDFDGKFKLIKVKKGDNIIFSYVGYKDATIAFSSQNNLVVSMIEESNQLQEVLIQVGYGTAKKKDATGSVALITTKDFNKGAIVSVDQLLAGKAAGVRITSDGGAPDSKPNIRIRGGASLNASNNPLIIIDGVPIGDIAAKGVENPFNLINPNDIESFSILKDASATAIYGVRASNGVILITTKKGTSGEPQFNYSASISMSKATNILKVKNGPEFLNFIENNQAIISGSGFDPNFPQTSLTNKLGIDDPNSNAIDDLNTKGVVEGRILSNTNWADEIYRTSYTTDHNFSVRANLYKKIPFRASLGYSKVQGLLKTNDYERFTYSFKMTPKLLHDDLKIDINAKGTYTDKNSVDQSALGNALSMDPTKPVYDSSPTNIFGGYYQELDATTNGTLGTWNPLALLQQKRSPERALRFLGNVEFDYKLPFLKDLHAVVNLGIDATDAKVRSYFKENALGSYTPNPSVVNQYFFNTGETSFEKQTNTNTTMDTYLTYSKSMTGFVTKFDAQAGYSYQNFVNDGNYRSYQNNATTGVREVIVDENNPTGRYYNPINLQAFFARTNVDILGKYLFTATLRADASSLFTAENRWGYFPAIGAAWKLKEESFLKNSKWIQDLKLRAGWGKTGQANIPGYFFPSQLLFQPGNTTSQYLPNQTVYTPLSYNPDLTWEKTTTVNLGLDFEIFKNGILSGSLDVYSRKTTDLLARVTFPAGGTVSGEFIKNIGSTEGNGVETALSIKAITTDNFSLNFGMNITYNYSTVSELGERTEVTVADTNVDAQTPLEYHHVGDQPSSAWVFEQVYNANGDPVVGAFVDRNGDGQITAKDRYYVAMVPNWTYGFSTNMSYKNWDLSASFRGQLGGQVYNANKKDRGTLQSAISLNGNAIYNVLDEVNPLINDYKSVVLSDYLLEDATFLRCDNISLSYKLPKFVKKSKLRVSGSVNNPFIITNYSGQDPENFGGIDGSLYPRPTTYTLGLSLDF